MQVVWAGSQMLRAGSTFSWTLCITQYVKNGITLLVNQTVSKFDTASVLEYSRIL
jgi:hypothetical protein